MRARLDLSQEGRVIRMSKAILVMDMPSSCNVCRYCEVHVRKRCLISACKLLPFSRIDKEKIHERQEWCPLREVPQKKEVLKREQYEFGSIGLAFTDGYNRCIDEILGGGE
jgi:hypothetical protein